MIQRTLLSLCTLVILAACSTLPTEKRHSPEEIARYVPEHFVAPIASAAGEQEEVAAGLAKIQTALTLPSGIDPTEIVPDAIWASLFLNRERDAARHILLNALPTLAAKNPRYQREILSAAHSGYAVEAAPLIAPLLGEIATPREFCVAAYTLLRASNDAATRMRIREALEKRFPGWRNEPREPRLVALDHVLTTDVVAERRARPPLTDLLAAPIRAGHPVVFSLQRPGREVFGLAVVRGADGRFVRNADGSFFAVPQLARALSNLPGTITNGNTPQGLFTIVGAGTATNRWIGPTPYLESKVPIEAGLGDFEHRLVDADAKPVPVDWSDAQYESFLPLSWRNYFPFKEALLAGRAGRDEMLIHGTVINSDYYRGASYYPGTPSAGCLVAMESWAPHDGRMIKSDQLSLAKAFTREGRDRGYLVVVELDERADAVSLSEIDALLSAAERAFPAR